MRVAELGNTTTLSKLQNPELVREVKAGYDLKRRIAEFAKTLETVFYISVAGAQAKRNANEGRTKVLSLTAP